jgi:hypothetical protein
VSGEPWNYDEKFNEAIKENTMKMLKVLNVLLQFISARLHVSSLNYPVYLMTDEDGDITDDCISDFAIKEVDGRFYLIFNIAKK